MINSKFINNWQKTRRRGMALYLLKYTILIPAGGLIGKTIAEFIAYGVLFRRFITGDYTSLVFLGFIGIFIGIQSWKRNENKFEEFKSDFNSNS